MTGWAQLRYVVLAALAAALGYIYLQRGLSFGVGAAPATIESRYRTEEAWVVSEIVRDVTEMATVGGPAATLALPTTTSPDGRYSFETASRAVVVDLTTSVWDPAPYAEVARAIASPPSATPLDATTSYRRLVRFDAGTVAAEAVALSSRLAGAPHDWRAHDAAALTIAAFALREAAGQFTDVRSAMSRMAAHLAIAEWQRGDAPADVDGQLARATLFVLANHQRRALATLDALPAVNGDIAAWQRALRLRVTQDWRLLRDPSTATPIEQVHYVMARRATVKSVTVDAEFSLLGIDGDADVIWRRLLRQAPQTLADSGLSLDRDLELDVAEANLVRSTWRLPLLANDLPADVINQRFGPAVADGRIVVLPWGAWAEQLQRHVADFVSRTDRHLRQSIGDEAEANEAKQALDRRYGHLDLAPLAAAARTSGPNGRSHDLSGMSRLVELTVGSPERVTQPQWTFVAVASKFAPMRRSMPAADVWFMPTSARTPYEAGVRLAGATRPTDAELEALTHEAPYDFGAASARLRLMHGETPPLEAVEHLLGTRLEFDTRALSLAASARGDETRRLAWQERACGVSSAECLDLAVLHADRGEAEAAAYAYERAYGDPFADELRVANTSGWLVQHYRDQGRTADAVALADRAAATGSERGLVVKAALLERLGRFGDAERAFIESATAYGQSAHLFGFYFRAVERHHRAEFQAAWSGQLAAHFPRGRVAAPVALAQPPARGVVVVKDSARSRAAGLQAGDIIVGVEGWQVETLAQYRAANATELDDRMRLTVWRGRIVDVSLSAPGRLMGVEFRNHPIHNGVDK